MEPAKFDQEADAALSAFTTAPATSAAAATSASPAGAGVAGAAAPPARLPLVLPTFETESPRGMDGKSYHLPEVVTPEAVRIAYSSALTPHHHTMCHVAAAGASKRAALSNFAAGWIELHCRSSTPLRLPRALHRRRRQRKPQAQQRSWKLRKRRMTLEQRRRSCQQQRQRQRKLWRQLQW